MPSPLSQADARELIGFCQAGRLYDVEAWVRSGRSLTVPDGVKRTPLGVALDTGFHSLIDLLLRHEESQKVKNEVLRHALFMEKRAFIDLAIAHGADVGSVPFLDVLLTGDRTVIASFIERGADPVTEHPFARAFYQLRAKTTIGSYLDCRRSRPDLEEGLQWQADMALRQFAQEGNLKWVSLLLWAGASPRSRGPTVEDFADPEWSTTALYEASESGNLAVLKRLQPDRRDDLAGMLERAASRANAEILEHLLHLGATANDKSDGGSSGLDICLRILGWEDLERVQHGDFALYEESAEKQSKGRRAIRVLLRHGALWTPDASTLDATRRVLYRLEPHTLVELLGQLRARANGEAALSELLRVRQLRQHLAFCERRLPRPGSNQNTGQHAESEVAAPRRRIVTRDDRWRLYDAVWSKPAAKVARRYGMSAVELLQACKDLDIPTPPRGYWVRKKSGQPVPRRPRLPTVQRRPR